MAFIDTLTVSPLVKSFLAGSFSGTCSTILFQPLDLVKTRLQNPTTTPSETGVAGAIHKVVKHDRLRGLWTGITPSMLRCVPGVGLYFSSLHFLKTSYCNGSPGPFTAMALGAAARTVTAVTMIPMTVIKTRFESGVYEYKGVRQAMVLIYKHEGFRGLTCGLLPTLLRDAPFSGLYLMFYTQTKQRIPSSFIEGKLSPTVHFSCGLAAGLMASVVTQPFDVLKTKMQLYPNKFQSVNECIIYVHSKYGMQGYFKGLVPRMVRRTLMAALAWTVYEQAMRNLGIK